MKSLSLQDYLTQTGETVTQFARRSGIPQPTVWRVYNNKVLPSVETARKIQAASKGRVKAAFLMGL